MRAIRLLMPVGLLLATSLQAQTIRGTVTDSIGMPLDQVAVSVLAPSADSVLASARTLADGQFMISLGRNGRFRIRLNRIGYAQQTSAPFEVQQAQVITLRFTMAMVAQRVSPMVVVERRRANAAELMSAAGFDLRHSKYPMNSIGAERLAQERLTDVEELFRNHLFQNVTVVDGAAGPFLAMSQIARGRRGTCAPEVYLDGFPINAAFALGNLAVYSANQIYGIESYHGEQIPPPSFGGFMGDGQPPGRKCGVVAVWTKLGREKYLIKERAKANGSVQVIVGTAVDFVTGQPIPAASLLLQSEAGQDLEPAVVSDSLGKFRIPTKQFGKLRIAAKSNTHLPLESAAFNVEPEELITIELILATDRVPPANVALRRRELPQAFTATSFESFDYRRRRGVGGVFFDADALTRSAATNLPELLRAVPNVTQTGGPSRDAILFTRPGTAPACTPSYYLNGELQREAAAAIRERSLASLRGVEVYTVAADLPYTYRTGGIGCGAIGVWTKS